MNRLIPRVVAAALGVLSITHALGAEERQLSAFKGMKAFVSDAPAWCGETVNVTIRSANPGDFSGDKKDLQRLLGGLRVVLDEECPKVTTISVLGLTAGGENYRGIAAKATDWALVDAAPQQAGASAAVAEPVVPPAADPSSTPSAEMAALKSRCEQDDGFREVDCVCYEARSQEILGRNPKLDPQLVMLQAASACPDVKKIREQTNVRCIDRQKVMVPRGIDPKQYCECYSEEMAAQYKAFAPKQHGSETMGTFMSKASMKCERTVTTQVAPLEGPDLSGGWVFDHRQTRFAVDFKAGELTRDGKRIKSFGGYGTRIAGNMAEGQQFGMWIDPATSLLTLSFPGHQCTARTSSLDSFTGQCLRSGTESTPFSLSRTAVAGPAPVGVQPPPPSVEQLTQEAAKKSIEQAVLALLEQDVERVTATASEGLERAIALNLQRRSPHESLDETQKLTDERSRERTREMRVAHGNVTNRQVLGTSLTPGSKSQGFGVKVHGQSRKGRIVEAVAGHILSTGEIIVTSYSILNR